MTYPQRMRIPLKSGDEQDAFSGWIRYVCKRRARNIKRMAKRTYNRRLRRLRIDA